MSTVTERLRETVESLNTQPRAASNGDGVESLAKLRTDTGNAARFVLQHGRDARYCYQTNQWFIFNGKRWLTDQHGEAVKRGKQTALSIYREAAAETDDAKRPAITDHATKSQRRERIMAMIELAKPELAISTDALDADPNLLNCENGTIDLRTGKLRAHDRRDYITKMCRAIYDPEAKAATFTRFRERIFRTYPALIEYVQTAAGYGATGHQSEQVLFFLSGNGANGKTTLLDAICYALGEYAGKADRELLAAKDGSTHPTNVADLMGKRSVICSETNEGGRLDEAKLKDLVGERQLKARFMRQNFFQFLATHKIWLYSNHKPVVRGTDHGFWRRIRLIPFIELISEEEKDTALPGKLEEEAAGILAWIVAGAVRWYARGLITPAEVTEATREYRSEMDSIGTFLDQACVTGENMVATSRELYERYRQWSEDAGEKPLSSKRLGMTLRERGLKSFRDSYSGRNSWRGIGLLTGD